MHNRKRVTPTVKDVDRDHAWLPDAEVQVTLPSTFGGVHGYITKAELASIVQQAYDEYGILPQLWTAEPPGCNGTSHCASNVHHAGCSSQAVPA